MKIRLNTFVQDTTILASGAAVGQLVIIFATPILSRIYDPQTIGLLGQFTAIMNFVSLFATLRFDQAIIAVASPRIARHLLTLSIVLSVITAIITLLVLIIGDLLFGMLSSTETAPFWLLPIGILLVSGLKGLVQYNIRLKMFGTNAQMSVLRSVVTTIVQCLLGFAGFIANGLIVGQLVGQLFAAIFLGRRTSTQFRLRMREILVPKLLWRIGRRHSEYPTYGLGQAVLNGVSQHLVILSLSLQFAVDVVGYYVMAVRVLRIPAEIVGTSLRDVFYQRTTELRDKESELLAFLLWTTAALTAIAILPTLALVLYADRVFEFVLGSEWETSGQYASWLVVWLAISVINRPCFGVLLAYRRLQFLAAYEMALLIARSIALAIGVIILADPLRAIQLYGITSAVFSTYILAFVILFVSGLRRKVS